MKVQQTGPGSDDIADPLFIPPRRPNPDVARQTAPLVEMINVNQNTPWEMAIYQDEALTFFNGRTPEEVVADHILASFEDGGRDIEITRELPVVPIDNESSTCEGGAGYYDFADYLQSSAPTVAADCNIMLMSTEAGGCGSIGGNVCVAAAQNITVHRGIVDEGFDPWARNVQAAMHEVGHNMGWGHCAAPNVRVHPGWGTNSGGFWHKTPETSCNDTTNLCGERIPAREHAQAVWHLHYNGCAFDQMQIEDKPLLPSGGGVDGGDGGGGDGGVDDGRGIGTTGLMLIGLGAVAVAYYSQND